MFVRLSFRNKNVCIVGYGHQGKRKEAQLKEEGANIQIIEHNYSKEQIKNAQIVIACTNNEELNHQIVLDANALGIDSASVNYDSDVTLHFSLQQECEGMKMAVSSERSGIFENKKLLEAFKTLYEEEYQQEFLDMAYIRTRMIEEEIENRGDILRVLTAQNSKTIHFIRNSYEKGQAEVYCFHGNTKGKPPEYMEFLNEGSIYVYGKKNPNVPSMEEIAYLLDRLSIETTYKIVMLQKGKMFQKVIQSLENKKIVDRVLNEEVVSHLFNKEDKILFIVHGTVDYSKLESENWKVMEMFGDIPDLNYASFKVVPLFLIRAKHMEVDIFQKVYPAIKEKYENVTFETKCLMEYPEIQEYIKSH